MFITDMCEGQSGIITALDFDKEFCTRLNDLGFCKGEKIVCVKKALLSSPILYQVKGSNIALRKNDADRIEVAVNE